MTSNKIELQVSGLKEYPREITAGALQRLLFEQPSVIAQELFVLQVLDYNVLGNKMLSKGPELLSKHRVVEISDGIGTSQALFPKAVTDRMILYEQEFADNSIIVIAGEVRVLQDEEGSSIPEFKQMPRVIVNELQERIGEPIKFIDAMAKDRYVDIGTKYPKGYFKVPLSQQILQMGEGERSVSTLELSLSLVDIIVSRPQEQMRNQSIFPRIRDSNLGFWVLSYAFHLDKAKTLLRRLSRTGFIMGTCAQTSTSQFDRLQKKIVEVPVYQGQVFLVQSLDFDKFFKVMEPLELLGNSYREGSALRTISSLRNLASFKSFRVLHHPYAFNLEVTKKGKDELVEVMEGDYLEELQFDMKSPHPGYQELFNAIKQSQRLKKLSLQVNPSQIEVLNKGLSKETTIKSLFVNFTIPGSQTDSPEIKFPKYLKHLKQLTLLNICDRNFTDTLFDLASQKRIKELSLGFLQDIPVPNFAEALQKYQQIQKLHLKKVPYHKINHQVFLEYLATGTPQLRSLHLESMSLNDDQMKLFLAKLALNPNLRELMMSGVFFESESQLSDLKAFLKTNKYLTKLILQNNMIQNLELVKALGENKKLKELQMIQQTYFKDKAPFSEKDFINHQNNCLERLSFSLGLMTTIKPLVQSLAMFNKLKVLKISYVPLTRTHFMVIDNYLIQNPFLKSLHLVSVKLGLDDFMVLQPTLINCKHLRKLSLNSNQLREQGCLEVANTLIENKFLQSLSLDQNEITELGIVALLKVVKHNKSLVKLSAQYNKFQVNRWLLGLVGSIFVYQNRTLRQLLLYNQNNWEGISKEGQEDRYMMIKFMQEVENKSNLKVLTL